MHQIKNLIFEKGKKSQGLDLESTIGVSKFYIRYYDLISKFQV